jgi:ribonuclease PH
VEKEKRNKRRVEDLESDLRTIFKQVIMTEKYPNSIIILKFKVIELDCSPLEVLVNACSIALLNSQFELKFVPIAASVALTPTEMVTDPSHAELAASTQKVSSVLNPCSQEWVYFSMS